MNHHELLVRIEYQRVLRKKANAQKGQRPHRDMTRSEWELLFHPDAEAPDRSGFEINQTVVSYAYPPCTASIASLKPILIEDLLLETHHRGRLLICRAFATALRLQAVTNAIEDVAGGLERLVVYNYDPNLDATQVLQTGGIYAIKEPYCEFAGDGFSAIRIDHPSDLVKLRPDDPNVPAALRPCAAEIDSPTSEELKAKGNAAYKNKDLHDALDHYSHALQICDKSDVALAAALHRNRALVHLNLERYEAALFDSGAAVMDPESTAYNLPSLNGKAYYRSGCAAYHLLDFSRAKVNFEKVLQIAPNDIDAKRELLRSEQRLLESTGHYDFEAMTASVNEQHRRLDHADYTSNVEVRQTADRGRGLFATRAIKAGEVVMCEKAFGIAFDDEELNRFSIIMNLNDNTISAGTHATRLTRVIKKILHSPMQASRLLDLHDAGYEPKVDVRVVEGDMVTLDIFRVQTILQRNGFGTGIRQVDKLTGGPTGVWVVASYINHDCIGNVSKAFVGDMMIVRASKDIEKDDEITMRYQNPNETGIQGFQRRLEQAWGFKCSCTLCQAEDKVLPSQQQRRMKLMQEMDAFLNNPANQLSEENLPLPSAMRAAERLYGELVDTYDEAVFRKLPRTALPDLSQWLCIAYATQLPNIKLLDMALQLLRDLGIMVNISKPQTQKVSIDRTHARPDLSAIHGAMYAGTFLAYQGRDGAAEQMREYGKELYKTMKGSMLGFEEWFGRV